jgi:short-subunit dehydrogenase
MSSKRTAIVTGASQGIGAALVETVAPGIVDTRRETHLSALSYTATQVLPVFFSRTFAGTGLIVRTSPAAP